MRMIVVRALWDAEAGVFVATSDDVPGLVAEAGSLQELEAKLGSLVPELLESERLACCGTTATYQEEVPLLLISEQLSKVRIQVHG